MKTALQELIDILKENDMLPLPYPYAGKETELLEKEREIAQDYARFATECDRKGMPILEFQDWVKL